MAEIDYLNETMFHQVYFFSRSQHRSGSYIKVFFTSVCYYTIRGLADKGSNSNNGVKHKYYVLLNDIFFFFL